jgi:hypothetical protein
MSVEECRHGDRLFYLMIVVIALIWVGLFAVKADEFALATIKATAEQQQSQSSLTLATWLHKY